MHDHNAIYGPSGAGRLNFEQGRDRPTKFWTRKQNQTLAESRCRMTCTSKDSHQQAEQDKLW